MQGQADILGQYLQTHPAAQGQVLARQDKVAARKIDPAQGILPVMRRDHALDDGLGPPPMGQGQVQAREQLAGGPVRHHPARLHQHQVIRQTRHLVAGVGDIQHGDIGLALQRRQVMQEFQLARLVQRGQGLVEQQQLRPQQQRPRNRNPLCLAAGKLRWRAIEQLLYAQQANQRIDR